MEIQWIMFAKEIHTNPDTTLGIDGIVHIINIDSEDMPVSMCLASLSMGNIKTKNRS